MEKKDELKRDVWEDLKIHSLVDPEFEKPFKACISVTIGTWEIIESDEKEEI